jgi:trimethylamine--corrinoid protein Co-methyltransferase
MKEKVERIHATAMAILKEVGVKIHLPETCRLLKKHGIRMDQEVAYFDEDQLMHWVRKAPAQFTLHARNPDHNAHIGGGQPQYAAGYGCAEVIDANTRRSATLTDYIRFAQLVHQIPLFNLNGGILVQPTELTAGQARLAMTYATLLYSDKCIMGQPGPAESVEQIMAMVSIVFGGRKSLKAYPRVLSLINTLSPLQLDRVALESIRVYAAHGQALLISAGVMSGATGPITLAGSLALGTAEVLVAIAISQMIREGTPAVMGLVISPADMLTGEVRLGVPVHAASCRFIKSLAGFYELPCRCGGSVTDASGLTCQSGYESMLNMLAARQAGVDLILHSAGILASFRAMSFEKFAADIEVIHLVDQYIQSIPVNDDTLAFKAIGDVGLAGQFLTHRHTLSKCRSVPFRSMLPNLPRTAADASANHRFRARLSASLEGNLSKYRRPDLPPTVLSDLESYAVVEGCDNSLIKAIKRTWSAAPPA